MGAVLSSMPAGAVLLSYWVSFRTAQAIRRQDDHAVAGLRIPFIVAFVLMLATTPWRWFIGAVIVFLLFVGTAVVRVRFVRPRNASVRRPPRVPFPRTFAGNVLPLVGVARFFLIVSDSPWLPSERLTSPTGTTVGYVLSSGTDLVLLRDSDRQVVRVPVSARREVCELERGSTLSWPAADVRVAHERRTRLRQVRTKPSHVTAGYRGDVSCAFAANVGRKMWRSIEGRNMWRRPSRPRATTRASLMESSPFAPAL